MINKINYYCNIIYSNIWSIYFSWKIQILLWIYWIKKNKDSKCLQCPNEILFKNLFIVSRENTLNEIIKYKRSISWYNDGEINLIFGHGINFQRVNNNISKGLLEILNSNEKKFIDWPIFALSKKGNRYLYK